MMIVMFDFWISNGSQFVHIAYNARMEFWFEYCWHYFKKEYAIMILAQETISMA